MPRKPIDYQKTIIYKLVCNDLNIKDIYVGHTTDFANRKRCHKSDCNNEKRKAYNYKVYKTMRENGGWLNWSMIEIEKFPCNDENEARAKEHEWYEKLFAKMNSYRPMLTEEVRKEENKQYLKKYYENNIEYYEKYYENNKEEINEYNKKYKEEHKQEIQEYNKIRNEKITQCACGRIYKGKGQKARHNRTRIHIENMERINQENNQEEAKEN